MLRLKYMGSREFYFQRDMFTDELVDTRTAKQKQRAQERDNPQQTELFPQRELAQFGVDAHPKLSLTPQSKLKLAIQDLRSEEEKELDIKRLIEKRTYPLPGVGEGPDVKVRFMESLKEDTAESTGLIRPPKYQEHEALKQQYPEAIILYRLGDFYETFGDDAKKIAHELDLVLTSRIGENKRRIPMAGMPYHVAESYIARLIEKGYSIALCEQIHSGENPNEIC